MSTDYFAVLVVMGFLFAFLMGAFLGRHHDRRYPKWDGNAPRVQTRSTWETTTKKKYRKP